MRLREKSSGGHEQVSLPPLQEVVTVCVYVCVCVRTCACARVHVHSGSEHREKERQETQRWRGRGDAWRIGPETGEGLGPATELAGG